jgi:hypothetical protein
MKKLRENSRVKTKMTRPYLSSSRSFVKISKKEGKFAHFKFLVEKSLTNCNNCKKYGHWAKNCLVPYEKVMKN